jgi:stress response protein SCP2
MKSRINFNVHTTKKNINQSAISKLLGKHNKEIQHFIDWDISVGVLNEMGHLLSLESFIFYGHCNYENGTITLRSDTIIFGQPPEFDEVVIIDFSKLPDEAKNITFYLSNQQKDNFEIANIDVVIESLSNIELRDNQLRITNSTTCNAIELFELIRTNYSWAINILNNPIKELNGLGCIVNKISSPLKSQ